MNSEYRRMGILCVGVGVSRVREEQRNGHNFLLTLISGDECKKV